MIIQELKDLDVEFIESEYAKFVLMYEFFRLLRGESFSNLAEISSEFQKEMYRMEGLLFNKVKALKDLLPEDKSAALFNLDQLVTEDLNP